MGIYLPIPQLRKVEYLRNILRATLVSDESLASMVKGDTEPADDMGLICVLHNGAGFDAALVVYNATEFKEARDPTDARKRTWLMLDRKHIETLVGRSIPWGEEDV